MGRDWIDEGLQQTTEREQQWQLASERGGGRLVAFVRVGQSASRGEKTMTVV
jgi:hypothetical protein